MYIMLKFLMFHHFIILFKILDYLLNNSVLNDSNTY